MRKVASGISTLLHPVFIPFLACLLLISFDYIYIQDSIKNLVLQSIFIVSLAIPLLCVFILKWSGMISSIRIPNVNERRVPYYITFASYLFLAMFFKQIVFIPIELSVLFFSCALSIFALISLIPTTKASAHMACFGGVTGGLYMLVQYFHYPFFNSILVCIILSGIVGWSRLKLKAHTPQQLLIGYSIGFCMQFLGYIFFNSFYRLIELIQTNI